MTYPNEDYVEIKGFMETRTAAFYDMPLNEQADYIVSQAEADGLLIKDECGDWVFRTKDSRPRTKDEFSIHNYTSADLRFLADELDWRNKV